jgi:hypothetical protein
MLEYNIEKGVNKNSLALWSTRKKVTIFIKDKKNCIIILWYSPFLKKPIQE